MEHQSVHLADYHSRRSSQCVRFGIGLLFILLSGVMLWSIRYFTIDDAYITYRYARDLVAGQGAVYNLGQRVEGFSSPLWFSLAVLAEWLKLSPAWVSKCISALTWWVWIVWFIRTAKLRSEWALAPLLVLATHGPLLTAMAGGLETAVSVVTIVGLWHDAHRKGRTATSQALWGGLALLIRPENALLVGIHGLYLWISRPKRRRQLYQSVALWLSLMVSLTLLRYGYYGELTANTARAKLVFEPSTWLVAVGYMWSWLTAYGWLLLGVLPALWFPRTRRRSLNGLWLLVGQVLFVLLAGGDWMPQWRFMLPIGVMAILLNCYSLEQIILHCTHQSDTTHRSVARTGMVGFRLGVIRLPVLMTIPLMIGLGLQMWQFRKVRWELDYYQRQMSALAAGPVKLLAMQAGKNDWIIARDIGLLGYKTDSRVLDLVGLTDPRIAATSGYRHRERIDCDYVYGRRPEFLMLQSEMAEDGERRLGRLARVLVADERFNQYERCGHWDLPGRHFCEVYRRRHSAGTRHARPACLTN